MAEPVRTSAERIAAYVQVMSTFGGPRYSADWGAVRAQEAADAKARAAECVEAEEREASERQRKYYESLSARAP